MELLTLDRLKQILRERGLVVMMREDGLLVIRPKHGAKENVSPALLRVLAMYRDELIAGLKGRKA